MTEHTNRERAGWMVQLARLVPRERGMLLLLPLLAVVVLSGGYLVYRLEAQALLRERHDDLVAVGDLTSRQIAQWRRQRTGDARLMAQSPFQRRAVMEWVRAPGNQGLRADLRERLILTREVYRYKEALLLNPGGDVLLAAGAAMEPLGEAALACLRRALQTGEPMISDLYRGADGGIHIDVMAPIAGADGEPLAVVLLRSDAEQFLYPLVAAWPTPSRTAETILLKRDGDDVLYLNSLRNQPDADPMQRVPIGQADLPGALAVQGVEGFIAGRDYRGEPVIADVRRVPDSDWYLVSKWDVAEIIGDARRHLGLVSAFVLLLMGAIAITIFLAHRHRQAGLYRDLFLSERARSDSESRLGQLVENAPVGIYATTSGGQVRDANPATARMLGLSTGAEVIRHYRDLGRDMYVSPERREEFIQRMETTGTVTDFLFEARRADGRTVWLNLNARMAERLEDGGFLIESFLTDVTPRIELETSLRESEELHRHLMEVAPVGIAVHAEGRAVLINPAGLAILGADSEDQVLGRPIADFIAPDRLGPALQRLERMLAGEQGLYPVDEVFRRVDGSPVDVEILGSALMYKGMPGVQVIATDITERKKAQAERERLVTAIEQAAEGIVITDVAGAIQYVNPMFVRLSGYAREDVMGRNPRLLKSGAHDRAFYAALWETLLGGESWQGQMVNRRRDGALYTVEMTISPVRDASGATSNFVATMRDITHEIDLEQQILQAQKMESIGRLAGGVAHDFNNMLSVIMGSVELAQLEVNEDHPVYADLREIELAAKRSADLTRQLLAFARKQTVVPAAIDVNETVEGMLKMLRRLIGEDVELAWAPGPEVGAIYIDPTQLDQVLANLSVNARDAMREGGRIVIETEKVRLDEAYCENHAGVAPGDFVVLSVSDTGCGMEKEVMERIFEPFFTTKAAGEGTGLGLSTVYGIVQQNGGFVHAYSETGEGSTFRVYLPAYAGTGGAMGAVEPDAMPRGSGEVILVVEDEEPILRLAERMLTQLGYTVLTASGPAEGIEAARASEAPIDLLLSDVIMPGMNGRELEVALRTTCPGLRTLFMSGYTADVIAHRGVLNQGVHFMPKPFTLRTLATTVHRVLHGTP